jgi:tetratricopeptide (TPR) repeat protein
LVRALAALVAACAFAQTSDYEQGVAHFQKGDLTAAIPFLTRAADAHPRDAQMWKALGVAYAARQDYASAEPALRLACELDAKLEDACYFQARALYAMDRYDASLKALERDGRGTWKVRLARAQALEALGMAERADKEFRESVALCRGADPAPGMGYGLFLIRQGRMADAVAPLEEVLKRYPASAGAQTYLGRALLDSGRLPDAVPHLERAVALAPSSAQAHLLLAKAYVRLGRAGEAQEHFEMAAKFGEEK